jgi:DNA-binding LacI/PurR family transcriptional regulator
MPARHLLPVPTSADRLLVRGAGRTDGRLRVVAGDRRGGRPAALVCLNDRIALGTYEALAAASLRVPGDVSVVSFDDSPLASWLRPALTSIALPH